MTATEETIWFPVTLRLDAAARVLVVGGGAIAANKVALLRRTAARIEIISRELSPELARLVAQGGAEHVAHDATPEVLRTHLRACRLAFAATDDRSVNRMVAQEAQEANVPVCAVDDPEPSSFITPAIVSRGEVQIAISTSGAAPVLARRLRERLEAMMPAGLAQLATFMRSMRPALAIQHPQPDRRRRIWENFLDGVGGEQALAGDNAAAQVTLEALAAGKPVMGEVWLVGAGPGNPDLLTLAALRMMQNADSVLYDRLLPPEILDRVRRDAERVFVGKKRSEHTVPQEEINAELVRRAKRGERVLRLKGGDPFIFGRGGEEIETLLEAGVPFRIVPGVSAANGCAASAGIPLTHRDCAQSCIFLTGHARADGALDLPWETIAQRGQTVVIYMGVGALAELCAALIRHGLPPEWPAAIVERGTWADQRVLTADLATLPARAVESDITSPALVIVGEVVNHRVVSPVPADPAA